MIKLKFYTQSNKIFSVHTVPLIYTFYKKYIFDIIMIDYIKLLIDELTIKYNIDNIDNIEYEII
jgi:hypothetical protein